MEKNLSKDNHTINLATKVENKFENINKPEYLLQCHQMVSINDKNDKNDENDQNQTYNDLSMVIEKLDKIQKQCNQGQQIKSSNLNIVEFKTVVSEKSGHHTQNQIQDQVQVQKEIQQYQYGPCLEETIETFAQRMSSALPKMKAGFEVIRENARKQIVTKCLALPGISVNGTTMGESKSQILANQRREFFQEIEQYIRQQHLQYFGQEYESVKMVGQGPKAKMNYNLEFLQQAGIMFAAELAVPVKIPECSMSGPISLLTVAKLKSLGLTVSQWFVTYYMFYRYVHDIDTEQNQGTSDEHQLTIYQECLDLIKKPHEPPFKMGTISKLTKLLETYKIAAKLACNADKQNMFQTPRKRARDPSPKKASNSPKKDSMSTTSATNTPRKSLRITASPKKTPQKQKKKQDSEDEESQDDEDLTLSTSSEEEDSEEDEVREPKAKRARIV